MPTEAQIEKSLSEPELFLASVESWDKHALATAHRIVHEQARGSTDLTLSMLGALHNKIVAQQACCIPGWVDHTPLNEKVTTASSGLSLNHAAVGHAKSLIASGKLNRTSPWSFSAQDGNRLLRLSGKDFKRYSVWFLGLHHAENPQSKAGYGFPIGKSGQIYRKAVIAAKQRAAQQGASDIERAADSLLQEIDKGQQN